MSVNQDAVQAALATVIDPEIRRPITEIGMVKDVAIDGGKVTVGVYLTISACPMQDTIVNSVKDAVSKVRDVTNVEVELDVMSPEQRTALNQLGKKKDLPDDVEGIIGNFANLRIFL